MAHVPAIQGAAYRDCTGLVAEEAERLASVRRAEIASTPQGRASIFVRRRGRIAFGMAGTVGACLTIVATALDQGLGPVFLACSWPFALLASFVARRLASRRLRAQMESDLKPTGDAFADFARLRARGPRERERALSRSREVESIAWPLTAIGLLAPLSIHLLFGLLLGIRSDDFEEWMQLSGALVGLSHLFMIRAAWCFPLQRRAWRGLLSAVVACAPGVLIFSVMSACCGGFVGLALIGFLVTGVIILVTGSVIIWAAYHPLGERLDIERARLDTN